ncbi:5-oxoprolinase subunit PxpB [Alphaproteobacteria bacterium LSUCC0684]
MNKAASTSGAHPFKRYLAAGDSGVIVNFADHDQNEATLLARGLADTMRAEDDPLLAGVRDYIPGMANLLIQYDPLRITAAELISLVAPRLSALKIDAIPEGRLWRLPVLYGGEAGPDLNEVAAKTGLSTDEVITRHSANILTVAIMGFMPGLGYMKGVDPALYLPRRPRPRQHVPALTVGIAMDQTVIYPLASPGGWNLIGRVPVRLFDPVREDPVLFRPGDRVAFEPVDETMFRELWQKAEAGEAIISPELPS